MKIAVVLLFTVFAISGGTAYGQSNQLPSERKYKSLQHAEVSIFKLPFELDSIQTVIYPEIVNQRAQLAPHYPDISTIERTIEARTNAFILWIETYPAEWDDYYLYLTNYINANK